MIKQTYISKIYIVKSSDLKFIIYCLTIDLIITTLYSHKDLVE